MNKVLNMKKLFIFSALVAFLAIGISSCNKEISVIAVQGVTITPSTQTVSDGATGEFSATITPANSTSKFLKWSSSNTDVATIDNYGRFAAKKPGSVTITAETSDGKISGTATLTVTAISVTGVTLNKTTLEIVEDDSETLTATVAPANASVKDVEWKSSDEKIATVDKDGKVTAIVPGKATITVTTKDGGKTATCAVTVKYRVPDKAETLDIWKNDEAGKRAILGGSANVTSDFLTYDATEKTVSWTANTTGKPRTATLKTGDSEITVTQIEAKDFAGTWKFTGKTFAPNTNLGVSAGNATVKTLTIASKKGQTAKDGDKEITNELTVAGLINTYVAEAAVDIDYAEKTYRFGIFFDAVKAQAVTTGKAGFNYVVLLPELGNGWGSYNFCPFPFNDGANQGWLWFVSDSFNKSHYGRANWIKCDGKDILGLSFVACKSSKPDAADFASVNVAGGYDVIYQCNVNTKDDQPFTLERQ